MHVARVIEKVALLRKGESQIAALSVPEEDVLDRAGAGFVRFQEEDVLVFTAKRVDLLTWNDEL